MQVKKVKIILIDNEINSNYHNSKKYIKINDENFIVKSYYERFYINIVSDVINIKLGYNNIIQQIQLFEVTDDKVDLIVITIKKVKWREILLRTKKVIPYILVIGVAYMLISRTTHFLSIYLVIYVLIDILLILILGFSKEFEIEIS